MKYELTCDNGKVIDLTSDILDQINGRVTRQQVLDRIEFYKRTNK